MSEETLRLERSSLHAAVVCLNKTIWGKEKSFIPFMLDRHRRQFFSRHYAGRFNQSGMVKDYDDEVVQYVNNEHRLQRNSALLYLKHRVIICITLDKS